MVSMDTIYKKHNYQYDQLVDHEDYEKNLNRFLLNSFNFKNKTVLEVGCGTGRVTQIYQQYVEKTYCYDQSLHMIEGAKKRLNCYNNIEFGISDNILFNGISENSFDIVIEGWSFGHSIEGSEKSVENITDILVSNCKKSLKNRGVIIIIETMGTNKDKPTPTSEKMGLFFNILEKKYGFKKDIIKTDYKFRSNREGEDILTFFFGDRLKNRINFTEEGVVKEFTAVFSLKIS